MIANAQASHATLAARLDHALGRLIRRTERTWATLSLPQRREYVEAYRLLRDSLAAISGRSEPEITNPWTPEEIADSMTEVGGGFWSSVGALDTLATPLPVAVAITERELRKSGNLPKTLNSSWQPVKGLARLAHGYTVAEVQEIRARPRRASPSTPRHSKDEERGWLAKAEAKYSPG